MKRRLFSGLLMLILCMLFCTNMVVADEINLVDASETKGSWANRSNIWYWEQETGEDLKDSFLFYKGCRYYLRPDGKMATGWCMLDGSWYYFHNWGGMYVDTFLEYKGCTYYVDENGIMAAGLKEINGAKYYFRSWGGMVKSGFVEDHGCMYYADENGQMVTGWKLLNNIWYYFNDQGTMKSEEFFDYKGCTYYVDENGQMAVGWKLIDNTWYYFHTWGGMYVSEFFAYKGSTYYVDENGQMAVGWKQICDDWYYFYEWGGGIKGATGIAYTPYGEKETHLYNFTDEGRLIGKPEDYYSVTSKTDEDDGQADCAANNWEVIERTGYSAVYGEIIAVDQICNENLDVTVVKVRVDEDIAGAKFAGQEVEFYYYNDSERNGSLFGFTNDLADLSIDERNNGLLELSSYAVHVNYDYDDDNPYWQKSKILYTGSTYYTMNSYEEGLNGTYISPEPGMKIVFCVLEEKADELLNLQYKIVTTTDFLWYQISDDMFYECRAIGRTSGVTDAEGLPDDYAWIAMAFVDRETLYAQYRHVMNK